MFTRISSTANLSTPLNINDKLVNITNSNDPKNFGSTETNRQWGASGVSNNASAAASSGGRKSFRRKIKNIVVNYKMKGKKMTLHSIKQKLKSILTFGKSRNRRSRRGRSRKRSKNTRRKRGQRGGTYQQYMGGIPSNASYSTGGVLPQSLSALANPSPFTRTGVNCVDNYNHNTNKGFQM